MVSFTHKPIIKRPVKLTDPKIVRAIIESRQKLFEKAIKGGKRQKKAGR